VEHLLLCLLPARERLKVADELSELVGFQVFERGLARFIADLDCHFRHGPGIFIGSGVHGNAVLQITMFVVELGLGDKRIALLILALVSSMLN